MISLFKLHMIHRCWRYRYKSEVASIEFLLNAGLEGKTLLDIGANKGVYSIFMSRVAGPDGRVIGFEPQPELGPHLQRVKEEFGLDNFEIVECGLSSSPGELIMRRSEPGSGRASVNPLNESGGSEELTIQVTTLDQYFADNSCDPISFIKCDVEDHEYEVFLGGSELLSRDMPTLLFEVHEQEAQKGEIFSYLTEMGYEGYFFHVTPQDHASLFHKGRGTYVSYAEWPEYEYCRPGLKYRNYAFMAKDKAPCTPL